ARSDRGPIPPFAADRVDDLGVVRRKCGALHRRDYADVALGGDADPVGSDDPVLAGAADLGLGVVVWDDILVAGGPERLEYAWRNCLGRRLRSWWQRRWRCGDHVEIAASNPAFFAGL